MENLVKGAKRWVGVLATLVIIMYVANVTMRSLRREYPLLDEEIRRTQRMVVGGGVFLGMLAVIAYCVLTT